MNYREMGKTGDMVSVLGFGCMRFAREGTKIDEKKAEKQIVSAIQKGVNYFDTAYIYPGSEEVLGNVLSKGYRERVFIATKLPQMQINTRKDMDRVLERQLKSLKTDYIDYYLLHMLTTFSGWERLKKLGVIEFLEEAKRAGKIRHICFSYHGGKEDFKKIIDDYPWEMCQIQYNYVDEHNQAGREGLNYAASKGIGVVIMEPLRGGFLVNKLPTRVMRVLEEAKVKRTPAEWALRWIWNQPEVTTVLSGMNDEAQVEENVRIACDTKPGNLTEEDHAIYQKVKNILSETVKVNCTGCSYCMPCPAGVNIPVCFSNYNDYHLYKNRSSKIFYLFMLGGTDGGRQTYASLCKKCGACEKKCPQRIPIREKLRDVSKELEGFYFKPAVAVLRWYFAVNRLIHKKSSLKKKNKVRTSRRER